MLNRQQKMEVVSDLKSKFSTSKGVFLVDYKGLTVSQLQNLRKTLRAEKASLRVAKARLMKIAAQESNVIKDFSDNFKNQVGLIFFSNEIPLIAKKVIEFTKSNEGLKVVVGCENSKLLTEQEIKFLASLPSREVLLAHLVGTLQAPLSMLVRILQAVLEKNQGLSNNVEQAQDSLGGGE